MLSQVQMIIRKLPDTKVIKASNFYIKMLVRRHRTPLPPFYEEFYPDLR